jgi:hypothetical protein
LKSNKDVRDEVKVTFRFVGNSVNPNTITSWIGIEPTDAHQKGDIVVNHPNRKYPTGYWGLTSPLSSKLPIEEHLNYLLDVLEPQTSGISRLRAAGLSPDFFCGFFTAKTSFGSSMRLESPILAKIAQLGIALEIHVYCDDDREEIDSNA